MKNEPMIKKVLIVEDNKKYASILIQHFSESGFLNFHSLTSVEGFPIFNRESPFQIIVCDITLERRMAGFFLSRRFRKFGFTGKLYICSTAFNSKIARFVAKYLLYPLTGADGFISKELLLNGKYLVFETKKSFNKFQTPFFNCLF
jgi:CheY-like chemotaxis protein